MGFLKGKKTFVAAIAMVVYAASALLLGEMASVEAMGFVIEAGAIVALRLGIKKAE